MKRLALCLLMLALPAAAFAADDGDVNFNLLITQPSYTGCADPAFDFMDQGNCTDLSSPAFPGAALVWVLVSRNGGYPIGIGGAQFGIGYDAGALDGVSWTLCTGGSEIPEGGWPANGTGNAVTWAGGCYNPAAGNARVGFFLAPDGSAALGVSVVPDPRLADPIAQYADCDATLYDVCAQNLGSAVLANGTAPLCENLCGGTPTLEKTWGEIKSMF